MLRGTRAGALEDRARLGRAHSNTRRIDKRGLAAAYGVPALAGRVLSPKGGSKYLEIHDLTAPDRLKPGLHTLRSSFAREVCGLEFALGRLASQEA